MATPHISANKGDIADIVLMPGDPLRARFIAETYLTDVVMFNQVRNMLGFTGYYNGKRISVMGSGMGMPSMGIYSYELYKFFDVQKIIRIGSCGAMTDKLKLFDVVLASSAYSNSAYAYIQNGSDDKIIDASPSLISNIRETASREKIDVVIGNIYSSDVFTPYYQEREVPNDASKYDCIAAEMEAFALFHNAKVLGCDAACLLTVVDSPYIEERVSAEDREKSFKQMVELALKSI